MHGAKRCSQRSRGGAGVGRGLRWEWASGHVYSGHGRHRGQGGSGAGEVSSARFGVLDAKHEGGSESGSRQHPKDRFRVRSAHCPWGVGGNRSGTGGGRQGKACDRRAVIAGSGEARGVSSSPPCRSRHPYAASFRWGCEPWGACIWPIPSTSFPAEEVQVQRPPRSPRPITRIYLDMI